MSRTYKLIEYRDQSGAYIGRSYRAADVPALLERLKLQGISHVYIDEESYVLRPELFEGGE